MVSNKDHAYFVCSSKVEVQSGGLWTFFLHASLEVDVYVDMPRVFQQPRSVLKQLKSLYGSRDQGTFMNIRRQKSSVKSTDKARMSLAHNLELSTAMRYLLHMQVYWMS